MMVISNRSDKHNFLSEVIFMFPIKVTGKPLVNVVHCSTTKKTTPNGRRTGCDCRTECVDIRVNLLVLYK